MDLQGPTIRRKAVPLGGSGIFATSSIQAGEVVERCPTLSSFREPVSPAALARRALRPRAGSEPRPVN